MPKYDEDNDEWYHTNRKSTYFAQDLTRATIETHGDGAHLYALERFLEFEKHDDELGMSIWRKVLDKLDKGEGQ
jgi:hypothetical protein